MDNSFTIKKGFTLVELAVVMLIIGFLLTIVIHNYTTYVNKAKCQATVREMGSIAQAAIDYYNSSGNPNDPVNPRPLTWPSSTLELGSPYMPHAVTANYFGGNYQLVSGDDTITVSTVVPKGVDIDPTEGSFLNITTVNNGEQISITQSVPNEFSERLLYDLKYLDK